MVDILFLPTSEKDLKRQYPELNNEPAFQKIVNVDLKFVWAFSNKSSPFCQDEEMSEKERAKLAYDYAFEGRKADDEKKSLYLSLNFPDRIKEAIDRMQRYEPSVRAKARLIVSKILANYEKMVDVNIDDFVERTVDKDNNVTDSINWTGRNNYVTSAAKISETLPKLISQVEEGFGITDSKRVTDDGEGNGAIKRFHTDK